MSHSNKSDEELLAELQSLFSELSRRRGSLGIEAAESTAMSLGKRMSSDSLATWAEQVSDSEPEPGTPRPKAACPLCGRFVGVKSYRSARSLLTRAGSVTIYRNYHYCQHCGAGFYPKDAELGLGKGESTPGVEKLCLDFALREPFEQVSELMELHHDLVLSTTQVKCIVSHYGTSWCSFAHGEPGPKRRSEQLAVMVDGSMQPTREGWKEGKLACLETIGFPSERYYLGSTVGLVDFEARLKGGLKQARAYEREVLWIGDGAPWLWKMQERLVPDAFCLLDWYHLKEHVAQCADALLGEGTAEAAIFRKRACDLLWDNRVDDCLSELEECRFLCGRGMEGKARRDTLTSLQTYIANHGRFMDYPTARARGWPVGSGPVESAHRSVWHVRLKRPGARWSAQGLERMAQLRILYKNVGPKRFYNNLRKAA